MWKMLARIGLILLTASCGRIGFAGSDLECADDPALCPDASPPAVDGGAPDAAEPDASTLIDIETDVAPQVVSGSTSCDSGESNLNRGIGIDADNVIYAVFECGGSLTAVVSSDGGNTFSQPKDLGIVDVDSLAVIGGRAGEIFIAAATATSVELVTSTDSGASWQTNTVGMINGEANWGVSMAVAGDSVYIARKEGDMRVFANHSQGVGSFSSVDLAMENAYGDILVDEVNGDVFAVTDTPSLHIRRSTDGGLTFEPEVNPAGEYHYSDWALANSTIFVAGEEDSFTRISLSDLTTSTATGAVLNTALNKYRALAASKSGGLFSTQVDATSAELSLTYFAPSSDLGTTIVLPAGTGGSITAVNDNAVVYLYTTSAMEVSVGVKVF